MIILFIEQPNPLVATLPSMRNSSIRSFCVALTIFLAKLHLGLSNHVLATLFHLDNKSVVSHIYQSSSQSLN